MIDSVAQVSESNVPQPKLYILLKKLLVGFAAHGQQFKKSHCPGAFKSVLEGIYTRDWHFKTRQNPKTRQKSQFFRNNISNIRAKTHKESPVRYLAC